MRPRVVRQVRVAGAGRRSSRRARVIRLYLATASTLSPAHRVASQSRSISTSLDFAVSVFPCFRVSVSPVSPPCFFRGVRIPPCLLRVSSVASVSPVSSVFLPWRPYPPCFRIPRVSSVFLPCLPFTPVPPPCFFRGFRIPPCLLRVSSVASVSPVSFLRVSSVAALRGRSFVAHETVTRSTARPSCSWSPDRTRTPRGSRGATRMVFPQRRIDVGLLLPSLNRW